MLRKTGTAVLVTCVFLCGCDDGYDGKVIYVDADAAGAADGTSWTDAFADLQSALDASRGGDEIWIAEGTYVPALESEAGSARTKTFAMVGGVGLYGGFSGVEEALDARDWETHVTILSGDLAGDDVGFTNNDENCYHVLLGAKGARLDGFTVTGGCANINDWDKHYRDGGGMLILRPCSGVTIANCTFTYNTALAGGGVSCDYATVTVIDCTFTENGGGAISGAFGRLTVSGSTFQASNGDALNSGEAESVVVTGCTFDGNSGLGLGGWSRGAFNVSDCTFAGNAGGVRMDGAGTISDCSFSNNTSYGVRVRLVGAEIRDCSFTNNAYYGGVYLDSNAGATIRRCTFTGNTTGIR
jgi:hypothetical protein